MEKENKARFRFRDERLPRRCWCSKKKKFVSEDSPEFNDLVALSYDGVEIPKDCNCYSDSGYSDKNGVPIFDRDILKIELHGKISYSTVHCDAYFKAGPYYIWEVYKHCEVIGNLREDADLLMPGPSVVLNKEVAKRKGII